MTIDIPPGYGQFTATFAVDGGDRRSTITTGFRNLGGFTAASARSNISAAWFDPGGICAPGALSNEWTIVERYTLLNVAGVLTSDVSVVNVPGTAGFEPAPPNVSAVIRKSTALAGRQYRGRTALPAGWIDESLLNAAGVIDAGEVATLNIRSGATRATMAGLNVPMYLLHSPPLGGGAAPAPTEVTSFVVQGLAGTQRRRLRR